jgi:hypothetical protein
MIVDIIWKSIVLSNGSIPSKGLTPRLQKDVHQFVNIRFENKPPLKAKELEEQYKLVI